MSHYQDFSSLPPDQERNFVVFEQRSQETSKKALTFGMVAGAIFGLLVVIIFLSYDAPENPHADDFAAVEASEEPRSPSAPAEPAPAAAAEPAEAEAEAEPAEAEEPAAEAPAPPPGATKAPPTAIVGQ